MYLGYSDEHHMLRDAAEALLAEHASVEQFREDRDCSNGIGFRTEVWRLMAEQGWPGVASPAELGGSELGQLGLGVIFECVGRSLSASPLESTVMMGIPWLLSSARSEAQTDVLRSAIAGNALVTLAVQERAHFSAVDMLTRVSRFGSNVVLAGRKINVLDVEAADFVILVGVAVGEGTEPAGLTAVLVPTDAPGVRRERHCSLDGRHAGSVELTNVTVPDTCVVGVWGKAESVLSSMEDVIAAQTAAQLLGISEHVFELTLDYLKSREQFGVKIGSFQALQHRAAQLFVELKVCRALVIAALGALDSSADDRSWLCSAAKAKACRVTRLATSEAIQMHGGIGVTDELDLGLYLKRATVLQQLFGDFRYHAERCARLRGY